MLSLDEYVYRPIFCNMYELFIDLSCVSLTFYELDRDLAQSVARLSDRCVAGHRADSGSNPGAGVMLWAVGWLY